MRGLCVHEGHDLAKRRRANIEHWVLPALAVVSFILFMISDLAPLNQNDFMYALAPAVLGATWRALHRCAVYSGAACAFVQFTAGEGQPET